MHAKTSRGIYAEVECRYKTDLSFPVNETSLKLPLLPFYEV